MLQRSAINIIHWAKNKSLRQTPPPSAEGWKLSVNNTQRGERLSFNHNETVKSDPDREKVLTGSRAVLTSGV